MKSLMISVSGVRGIIGEGLTPDIITRFATAFGYFCGGETIVVGRDARTTGSMMEYAVFAGLMASGCKVLNLGISATPTIQLAVEKLKANGGVAITASHNPEEWNAIKLIDKRGRFLDATDGLDVLEIAESKKNGYVAHSGIGNVVHIDSFNNEHIKAILNADAIKPEVIRRQRFKVVVDCINGAGSYILPELLLELGCDVVKLNCGASGIFTRGPEPVPENIGELCEKVVSTGAAVGFACDPDADRLAVVDETGIPIGEEYSLVLAVKHMLSKHEGDVATNVSTTAAVDDVASAFGRKVHRSKVGEVHVVKAMIENNCIIGGEGNGGVIYPAVHYGRDAMVGSTMVLQFMAESSEKLSAICKDLPKYYISKRRTTVEDKKLKSILEKIRLQSTEARIDTTDGLKLIFPHYWVHLRKSNTEPIIRIITEARTQEEADSLSKHYIQKIERY